MLFGIKENWLLQSQNEFDGDLQAICCAFVVKASKNCRIDGTPTRNQAHNYLDPPLNAFTIPLFIYSFVHAWINKFFQL